MNPYVPAPADSKKHVNVNSNSVTVDALPSLTLVSEHLSADRQMHKFGCKIGYKLSRTGL